MQDYYYLLPCILHDSAEYFFDKTALVINGFSYSYQDIYRDSLAFSEHLKIKQYATNNRVLILSGNTYLTIVAFWGSLFAELVPCIVDPDVSSDVLNHMTINIEPCLIIQKNALLSEYCGVIQHRSFFFNNNENDLAIMMHTSGSTGYPKGVMLSHRNVIAAIESISDYLGLFDDDVILSVLPLHFDYGLYQMLLAFKAGATLVLESNALFPHFIAKKIEDYKVSVLPCVPLLIQMLFLAFQQHVYDFSSVRIVTNTGESLSYQHIQKMKSLFPFAIILSMYGLTECKRCSYVPSEMLEEKWESIGIPIPNLSMWIQDSEGNQVGPNIEGELVVSGPTVMMGYWRDCFVTDKKLKITPDNRKILLTGDRAIMDKDGYFYFKGRKDFIVKFNGAKLNCHDYAQKLMLIDGVNRAYLFLTSIDDLKQLVVCIELDSAIREQDELKKEIAAHFTSAQRPRYWYFTHQFPALGNGKLDKYQLENIAVTHFLPASIVDNLSHVVCYK